MMKSMRIALLAASALVMISLVGGGLALKVGAEEGAYRQSVVFAEVLSLVLDNYVDPVDSENLLHGAYEGMLGGLDPNGAYLTPEEVREWKSEPRSAPAAPGFSVLKVGRLLQVVFVEPESPASDAGIVVGDRIRAVDSRPASDISLLQARRLLRGQPGSTVTLEVLQADAEFEPQRVELVRRGPAGRPYELSVVRGIAVLTLHDLSRVSRDEMAEELDDVRSRGVSALLVDLRNAASDDPRSAAGVAGCFAKGPLFNLRDVAGELVESLASDRETRCWDGSLAVLVNRATAGGAEALAAWMSREAGAKVFGEPTYGLGAEPKLFELEDGSGLVLSNALWETASGGRWHGEGIAPDTPVEVQASDFAAGQQEQLDKVLELIEESAPAKAAAAAA